MSYQDKLVEESNLILRKLENVKSLGDLESLRVELKNNLMAVENKAADLIRHLNDSKIKNTGNGMCYFISHTDVINDTLNSYYKMDIAEVYEISSKNLESRVASNSSSIDKVTVYEIRTGKSNNRHIDIKCRSNVSYNSKDLCDICNTINSLEPISFDEFQNVIRCSLSIISTKLK